MSNFIVLSGLVAAEAEDSAAVSGSLHHRHHRRHHDPGLHTGLAPGLAPPPARPGGSGHRAQPVPRAERPASGQLLENVRLTNKAF